MLWEMPKRVGAEKISGRITPPPPPPYLTLPDLVPTVAPSPVREPHPQADELPLPAHSDNWPLFVPLMRVPAPRRTKDDASELRHRRGARGGAVLEMRLPRRRGPDPTACSAWGLHLASAPRHPGRGGWTEDGKGKQQA